MAADDGTADQPVALPVGTIILWAGDWPTAGQPAPAGWLPCDGSVCPSTAEELQALLADSGCPFGGTNGAPLLPNLHRLFVRGAELTPPPGWDPDAPREVGSHQPQDIVRHQHQYTQFPSGSGPYTTWSVDTNSQWTKAEAATASAGSSETYPTHVCFAHLIKAEQDKQEPPPPVGTVVMYGGGPDAIMRMDGWQLCNGDPVTDEHRALRKLLPNPPFLPDTAGLFVRGVDTRPTSSTDPDRDNTRFQIEGTNHVFDAGPSSLQRSALRSHTHSIEQISSGTNYADWTAGATNGWEQKVEATSVYPPLPPAPSAAIPQGRETRPANIALLLIISVGVESRSGSEEG